MATVALVCPYEDDRGNVVVGSPAALSKSTIRFAGSGCRLELGEGVRLEGASIHFDCNGGLCTIGPSSTFRGTIRVGLRCTVRIGANLSVTRSCFISAAEMTTVEIGDDCMFATHNEIRSDDAHPIFDSVTGVRINPSREVRIGNHVWLAGRAVVLAGATVGSGSVVGHGSVVTGHIAPDSIAAGVPAKVIRSGVRWEKSHLTLTRPYHFPGAPPPPEPPKPPKPASKRTRVQRAVRKVIKRLRKG